MRKTVCYVWITALVLAGCGSKTSSQNATDAEHLVVSDVVAMNTVALGGEPVLDAVQTMVKRSLIEEKTFRDIAVFATDRQGRMRVDIFAEGARVFAESYDGQFGHQWTPDDGQTNASEGGTIALSHTPQLPNHIFRLKDVVANGHTLELIGTETIDEVDYFVLKLTLSDGFVNFLFVDSSSGLVTRTRNKRALHVDIDDNEKIIESRMSDFRRVGELLHPHRVEELDLATGETLVRVTLQNLEVNKTLPENYFVDLAKTVPGL